MGTAMSAETDIRRQGEEKEKQEALHQAVYSEWPQIQEAKLFKRPLKRNTGACFKYGKVSHQIKDCPENKDKGIGPSKPNENKTNTRVYAITQEEADNTNEVVAGIILLNEMPAYTLFDCGATRSFVSRIFAKKLKLGHETLSEALRVATPASKKIETHKVYRNCKIYIHTQIFEAELIQLNVIEFDIILGMD
ncbi:uncharacterized protein [Primulina eburnea]|uniref:uncharacterized protein n=1 Tax=Primulina eburnea TaxID=1245227 RepID=UPI003C6C405F